LDRWLRDNADLSKLREGPITRSGRISCVRNAEVIDSGERQQTVRLWAGCWESPFPYSDG